MAFFEDFGGGEVDQGGVIGVFNQNASLPDDFKEQNTNHFIEVLRSDSAVAHVILNPEAWADDIAVLQRHLDSYDFDRNHETDLRDKIRDCLAQATDLAEVRKQQALIEKNAQSLEAIKKIDSDALLEMDMEAVTKVGAHLIQEVTNIRIDLDSHRLSRNDKTREFSQFVADFKDFVSQSSSDSEKKKNIFKTWLSYVVKEKPQLEHKSKTLDFSEAGIAARAELISQDIKDERYQPDVVRGYVNKFDRVVAAQSDYALNEAIFYKTLRDRINAVSESLQHLNQEVGFAAMASAKDRPNELTTRALGARANKIKSNLEMLDAVDQTVHSAVDSVFSIDENITQAQTQTTIAFNKLINVVTQARELYFSGQAVQDSSDFSNPENFINIAETELEVLKALRETEQWHQSSISGFSKRLGQDQIGLQGIDIDG